jgi:hypothetical protein
MGTEPLYRPTLGWSDLNPGPPTTAEILKQLAGGLNREAVVKAASILNLYLNAIRGQRDDAKRDQQRAFVKELLPGDLAQRALSRIDAGTASAFFFPEQLLLAARISSAIGQPGPSRWDRFLGAEYLLRVSDIIVSGPGDRDALVGMMLRQLGSQGQEQERYLLPRYFDIMVTRARKRLVSIFDEAFERRTGLSIEGYLAGGLFLSAPFVEVRAQPDLERIGFDTIFASAASALEPAYSDTLQRLLVAGPHSYGAGVSNSDLRHLALSSFVSILDKPYFPLSNGSAIPISPRLALERLSTGIYWEIFSDFAERDPVNGVVAVNSMVGDLFQEYSTEALAKAYQGHPSAQFIAERDIQGANKQASSPDGVVVQGSAWVSIEMTVSTLSMKTLVSADADAFRAELNDDQLLKKLGQPVIGAKNLLDGLLSHRSLDPATVTDVFPLVLFMHPFPQHWLIWDEVDRVYRAEQFLWAPVERRVNVHRLQFISAEEMEMLEAGMAMGMNLAEVLRAKEMAELQLSRTSLKNYMFATGMAREHDNQRLKTLLESLPEQLKPHLHLKE